MALHRDIYWVGRQWAVTGYGIQACNQKQRGKFDIEGARLWEDGVLESMRTEKWINIEDFDKAIEVARKYYPEPPRKAPPPEASVLGLIETLLKETGRNEPALKEPVLKEAGSKEMRSKAKSSKARSSKETSPKETSPKESPAEPPNPAVPKFDMRIERWPAKFVAQWRIRVRQ